MARFSQTLDVGSVLDREEKFEQAKADAAKREEERRRQEEEERKRQEAEERKAASAPPASPIHHPPTPHAAGNHPAGKPPAWLVLALLAIVLITGFKVLTIPAKLSHIDELAEEKVEALVLAQLTREAALQYPEFPAARHAAMAQERLRAFKQDSGYGELVRKAAEERKALYRDSAGQTYLYATDPYLYLRWAGQIEEGSLGEKDILRDLPNGHYVKSRLFADVSVAFHRAWRVLEPSASLEKAAFYLPVALGLVALVLVFILLLTAAGLVPAFAGTFLLAIHPRFFVGTYAGYTDTQAVALPLSIAAVLLVMVAARERQILAWRFAAGAGALAAIAVLSRLWDGWFYIPAILAAWLTLWGCTALFRERRAWSIAVAAAGLAVLTGGLAAFGPRLLSRLLERAPPDIFPQGYATVTELQGLTLAGLVTAFGGLVLVLPVLVAFVALCKQGFRKANRVALLAAVWLLATAAAGFLSRRFSFYAAAPLVVVLGLGVHHALPWLERLPGQLGIKTGRTAARVAVAVLVPLVALAALSPQVARYDENLPDMHDALAQAGAAIRGSSEPDARVFAWWSHGYQVQYAARRATAFDPASFGGHRQYWMARAFTTSDGVLAEGILRVLFACDAGPVAFSLPTRNRSVADIVTGMEHVLTGRQTLDEFAEPDTEPLWFTDAAAKLACTPPEGFSLMTEDTRLRLSIMPNFARDWDFTLAELRQRIEGLPRGQALALIGEALNLTPEEAVFKYEELRGFEEVRNAYRVSDVDDCIERGDVIGCANDFFINATALDARKAGARPERLVLVRNGTREERRYADGKGGFAVVVFKDGNGGWKSFLIEDWLADSMAVRWYTAERGDWYEPVFVADEPERVVVHRIHWNATAGQAP